MDTCVRICTTPFASTLQLVQPPGAVSVAFWPDALIAMEQLQSWLDRGAGAQAVQTLLLSAAGLMPSALTLPLSASLHRIWRCLGDER